VGVVISVANSALNQTEAETQGVSRRRAVISPMLAVAAGAVFAYLPYKIHSIIWTLVAPNNTLLQGDSFFPPFTWMVGVTSAVFFGSLGLCADPLLECIRIGYKRYLLRYGAPNKSLNYPWKLDQIAVFIFFVGPISLLLTGFYLCNGYDISDKVISFRSSPFAPFYRMPWREVQSIDIDCFIADRGLAENFTIISNNHKASLGDVSFDEYGHEMTAQGVTLARFVLNNHIHRISYSLTPGCQSADVLAIFKAASPIIRVTNK